MRMGSWVGLLSLSLSVAGLAGCATTTNHREPGRRVLDAVVVAREFEPYGSRGGLRDASELSEEQGSWYLVFEARDGEANARYRLPVTRQQYMRCPEGAYVQITLVGYNLYDVRRRP